MKKYLSLIFACVIITLLSGCEYFPWTKSTGTVDSDKIYLNPAIGDTRFTMQLSETVHLINYGNGFLDGGPTFSTNKSIFQIRSEIMSHNSWEVVIVRDNAVSVVIPNTETGINHVYIIMYNVYAGEKTYHVTEAKVIFPGYDFVLFPIYMLAGEISPSSLGNWFMEDESYYLLDSTIDDFIDFYETINMFDFTFTEDSITVTGMKNTNLRKHNPLITSFTLTFTDNTVNINISG